MSKDSTRSSRRQLRHRLPKLGRIFLDADVDARLERYLTAIGFDVVFATRSGVNIRDDVAVLKWARRRRRFMVTHDRFKDGPTKHKLYQEVYDNGGKIIQIVRKQDQSPVMLLGKILVHRRDWLKFFEDNEGIVLLHSTGMKPMPRDYLIRQIQNVLFTPVPVLNKRRRATRRSRRKTPIPDYQGRLALPEEAAMPEDDGSDVARSGEGETI